MSGDEFRGMIAPGGCGSTCSDELKREYEALLCPAAPPPPGSMGSMSGMGSMGGMSSGPICGDYCCDNGSDPLATTCPMMGGEDYINCPVDCPPPYPPPPAMMMMGSMMGPPPPYPPPGSMGSMSGMGSMGSMGGGSMGPPPPAPGGLPCDPAMCIPMFPGDAAMCHMPMCMGCADCMAPPHPPPHHGPPPCAMTCPTHMPTCAEFHQFVGPGGCASTCPDDLKTEGHMMFCKGEHGGPPPCAATCPHHPPSCDEFR